MKKSTLTILSTGTFVTGDVISEGELHVEGLVSGDISASRIILGQHARVSGSITAETVEIYGTVTGQIFGRFVKLGSTARVTGDITQESIGVEVGAILEGRCHRSDGPIEAKAPPLDLLLTDGRK